MTTEEPKFSASVKVMRSYDYCHFEVNLGSTEPIDLAGIDAMRKAAARLADKAVAQYKVAKANAQRLLSERNSRESLVRRMDWIRERPEGERSVNEQAELKAFDDAEYEASRPYNYEDDWEDDRDEY
jgi:endonuclease YncB( thermonuclease family)